LHEAEPSLRQALELRKKALGPEHPDVASTMTLLAGALIDSHRFDEARGLATQAKAVFLKSLGPAHWRVATAMTAEGAALAGLKQYQQAEELLLKGNGVLHGSEGVLPYYVKTSDRWLAQLYQGMGQPAKAAKYLAQAARSN
jgi:tetratricopeptide (TPR) repeat protein